MNNNQNIFERLSSKNQESNFSNIQPTTSNEEVPTEKPGNIFEELSLKEKLKEQNQFGFLDTVRDVGEQIATKGISGFGGAYGNLLDTFGLQTKEGEKLPGKENRLQMQSAVLDKLNRGETPSFEELSILSDDDILPDYNRLPSSEQIKDQIKESSGINEGKTSSGRIAGRGSEFLGEGAALAGGLKSLATLTGSGLAGQSIREAGKPEFVASGTEILGSILPSVISKRVLPTSTQGKRIAASGRSVGLSENQIAPLIQGETKATTLSKIARKGERTKNLFSSIKETLGDSYNSIKARPEATIKIPVKDQSELTKRFQDIHKSLLKTLAPSPDKEAALNHIETSLKTLGNIDITPEHLVNYWQDINESVKWNSINGGKKALAQLKEPISEILQNTSPQLAKDFEMTNELYSKYAQISKKLKPDLIDSFVNKGEILAIAPSALALINGNPFALGSLASEAALRVLGREMLINPYFQNIANKLVQNFNQSSLKGITQTLNQTKEFLQRKHPNEDWSFLTDDQSK